MAEFSQRVKDLLAQMTLDEKIAQTFQDLAGQYHEEGVKAEDLTGAATDETVDDGFKWMIGSVIDNASCDPEKNRRVQETYLKHNRLKIPLLLMTDALHGYRTVFPLPIALSCAFEGEPAYMAARAVAEEVRAAGVHVTFAPMLDLSRDARWGRLTEGPGEDPYLGQVAARAWVSGFQGESEEELQRGDRVVSTLKHFAGYGFVCGGRDYDETDMSEHTLREFVLPAFRAGVDAGAQMVMSAFTSIDGIPATGNKKLLRTILREEMGFDGTVISDYGSVGGIAGYNVAQDGPAATKMAVEAGCDIDMMAFRYTSDLRGLIARGEVTMEQLDTMVGNILTLKEKLGLFEDPYHGISEEKAKEMYLGAAHRAVARQTARRSAVLLQNNGLLPFSKTVKTVAVIGPHAYESNLLGTWASFGDKREAVQISDGIRNALPGATVIAKKGCSFTERDDGLLAEAVEAAKGADIVVLAIGEPENWTGESHSMSTIRLSDPQLELAQAVIAANPNTAVTLINGRPMDITALCEIAPAVLECWFMGSEMGNAVADLLFGDYEPTGRLAMTFPRGGGQVPVFYNRPKVSHLNESGSPDAPYVMRYLDISLLPQFPFGHGLGYTTFAYSDLTVPETMTRGETIPVSVTVTNTGAREGTETVQLYLKDEFAQVMRPVKELKGAQKVTLKPGESAVVRFDINEAMLKYDHLDHTWAADNGTFLVMIGHDSTVKEAGRFLLQDAPESGK